MPLFGQATLSKNAFSLPRKPILLSDKKLRQGPTFNVLATNSDQYGVEYWDLIEDYVDSNHVKKMFRTISKRDRKALIFLDNASYFLANSVKKLADESFDAGMLANVAYQPKLNCIELVNRMVKQSYKAKRLESLANTGRCDSKKLAR